jgi:hypothetical protein
MRFGTEPIPDIGRSREFPLMVRTILLAVLAATPPPAGPAPDAVAVRIVHPEKQAGGVLDLFQGSRATSPAAALAAWKRATGGRTTARFGKPAEAVLAAINPQTARELRVLHDTELTLGFEPGTGRPCWRSFVPGDDGTLAALVEALMLTEGAAEAPLGPVPVLRLGPPGSALSARGPDRLALASTRDGLRAALAAEPGERPWPDARPGLHLRLDPAGFRTLTTANGRRAAEALDAIGCHEARGWLGLDGETLHLEITARLNPGPREAPPLDPRWFDMVPARGVLATVAFSLDNTEEATAASFAILDRIDRADPARAGLAPLRTRVNLAATAVGVAPEGDLWPNLKGVTLSVLVDDQGRLRGGILALHATDEAAAGRIAGRVLPRLATSVLRAGSVKSSDERPRGMGSVGGKPVEVATWQRCVLVGWGERALADALAAWDDPARSAGASIRDGLGGQAAQRAGALWPGRLRQIAEPGSPLARALDASPPVVWSGRTGGRTSLDRIRWTGLRDGVRRWLDALPLALEPSPDRGPDPSP